MLQRPYSTIFLSDKASDSLRKGAAWVFAQEEVAPTPSVELEGNPKSVEQLKNGEIVDLRDSKGKYLATAFYSQESLLRYRLITRNANDRITPEFWARRVQYALQYRLACLSPNEQDAFRLIFGEADGFPGLIVDLYHDRLVTEVTSFGLEQQKEVIYAALVDALTRIGRPPVALFEKNDLSLRTKESLERYQGYYTQIPSLSCPQPEEVVIQENGLSLIVPYGSGQKTGYFLDQKRNRKAFAQLAQGRRVLECFSNSASFGLNALSGGAEFVLSVDVSQPALDLGNRNRQLNGFSEEQHQFLRCDVLHLLHALVDGKPGIDWDKARQSGPYDLILLDPPAFAKKKSDKPSALKAYTDINRMAMQLLPRGGFLATCTCSHFADDDSFRKCLQQAALQAKRELRQIEERRQCPDHPILWGESASSYLKFFTFQVV